MTTAQSKSGAGLTLYVRDFPADLMKSIDEYAASVAGSGAVASRPKTVIALLQKAITDATRDRKGKTR